jgi:hypothetical protein
LRRRSDRPAVHTQPQRRPVLFALPLCRTRQRGWGRTVRLVECRLRSCRSPPPEGAVPALHQASAVRRRTLSKMRRRTHLEIVELRPLVTSAGREYREHQESEAQQDQTGSGRGGTRACQGKPSDDTTHHHDFTRDLSSVFGRRCEHVLSCCKSWERDRAFCVGSEFKGGASVCGSKDNSRPGSNPRHSNRLTGRRNRPLFCRKGDQDRRFLDGGRNGRERHDHRPIGSRRCGLLPPLRRS